MNRKSSVRWWIGLGLVVLVAGAIGYRFVAPRRALWAYKAELRSAGEALTLQDLHRASPPESLSAAHRFTAAAQRLPWLQGPVLEAAPAAMKPVAPGQAAVGWRQAHLDAPTKPGGISAATAALLQRRYGLPVPPGEEADADPSAAPTWSDLAAELRAVESELGEIREAAQAPSFDWNLDYSQGATLLLPHLAVCKRAAQWLSLGTLVALHDQRLQDALGLLEDQLGLAHNLRDQDLLIDQLVRIALATIAWNATWEACQADGWTDSQLARMQGAWQGTEFVQPMIDALALERVVAILEYDRCRRSPNRLDTLSSMGGGAGAATGATGLFDQVMEWIRGAGQTGRLGFWAALESWDDERSYLANIQSLLIQTRRRIELVDSPGDPEFQLPAGEVFLPRTPPEDLAQLHRHLLASMMFPSTDKALEKAFRMQGLREMAVTAIGLKRYRLQQGEYPQRLEELVPRFLERLPVDWMDGQPLRYRRLSPEEFLLYSVGNDGKDDGGDPTTPDRSSRQPYSPYFGRDFVWPKPATDGDLP